MGGRQGSCVCVGGPRAHVVPVLRGSASSVGTPGLGRAVILLIQPQRVPTPLCCPEAVNSRKLPASQAGGGGRGGAPTGSLALAEQMCLPRTAAEESSNRSVFACCKRDLCEGPLEGGFGGDGALPEVLTGGPQRPLYLAGWGRGGGKARAPGCGSCWVIFLAFYSQLPNTVASCCS